MRRPPFKLDGRGAQLRYTSTRTGRTNRANRRACYCWGVFLQAVVGGDCDGHAEMRLHPNAARTGKWHRVEVTLAEARALLLADPLMRGRVAWLDRRRGAPA